MSPCSPALQELDRLQKSSPDFSDQLYNAICRREYVQCTRNLEHDDLRWLTNYLDEVLNCLDPSGPTFRKCLRELRSLCGTSMVLPTSFTLPSQLLEIDPIPLTSGSSCDVYRGILNGSRVCVKRVRVYAQDTQQTAAKAFYKEVVTWKHLAHPNILPLLGVSIHPFQLVSDWVFGGNLLEYILKHPNVDRLRLLSDVAKGLRYLHSRSVIHGGLKGSNILVENSGHARIADIGLAEISKNLNSIRSISNQDDLSMRWTAPEVWSPGEHSEKVDIFSFAMVMIEIFTGAVPFSDHPSPMAMVLIAQGERPPRPAHSALTDGSWELMRRCWGHEPNSRPDASEVLQSLLMPNPPTWKRLASPSLSVDERAALIASILSNPDEAEVAARLSGGDAQTFVDTIYGALDSLTPDIRKRCLHYLSTICGRHGILPKLCPISLYYDPTEAPLYFGKYADVWKGRYDGKEVAVKVLRVSVNDLGRTKKRFCRQVVVWKALHHPNVLPLLGVTMTDDRFTMVSDWMGNGSISEFAKTHPNANKLELLADVAKGLVYMHSQGITHGNINASDILIDINGRACLAGLYPLMRTSDELTVVPSDSYNTAKLGDNERWPAPEILEGRKVGKAADIFSFSMVTIEVFTGTAPFGDIQPTAATLAITRGRHPSRPRHPDFSERLWKLVQRCWNRNPSLRPEAPEVLQVLLDSNPPAWKRLASPTLSMNERAALITSVFSDRDEAGLLKYLSGDDAQVFVDAIDEASETLNSLPSEIRRRCLHSLCSLCARKVILPKSLPIPLCYDPVSIPQFSRGYTDLWKGEHENKEVAAKVLRVYMTSDLQGIRKRFCKEIVAWRMLRHPNVLPLVGVTMTENRFVTVSEWMQNGNITQFLENGNANRLELLIGVTRGLIYLHDQGAVHGNLKGTNIMIDNAGRAVLSDFSLVAFIPDHSTFLSLCMNISRIRAMSPELLDPGKVGLRERRETKESDYYALGMMAYEILSGCEPFGADGPFIVIRKVLDGEHPDRPQGEAGILLTDGIWNMMKSCWKTKPGERATARNMLRCLEGDTPAADGDDDESDATYVDSLYDELDAAGSNHFDSPPRPPSPVVPGHFWIQPKRGV